MGKVTDDERREVAARLRRLAARHPEGVLDVLVAKRIGLEYDADFFAAIITSESVRHLANLIGPPVAARECVPGECPVNVRHDSDAIDRDALLGAAEGMLDALGVGARSGEGIDPAWCRELHDKYARRIRKACGAREEA